MLKVLTPTAGIPAAKQSSEGELLCCSASMSATASLSEVKRRREQEEEKLRKRLDRYNGYCTKCKVCSMFQYLLSADAGHNCRF